MRTPGVGWVFSRELAIRSRNPAWLRGSGYPGMKVLPWLFTACALVPVIGVEAPLVLYTFYLYYMAVHLCARSLWDFPALRLARVTPWRVFVGKWVASLVPLTCELLLVGVLLAFVVAWKHGWASHVLHPLVYLALQALWAGLWGTYCAATSTSPHEAASKGSWAVHILVLVVPVFAVATLVRLFDQDCSGSQALAALPIHYHPAFVGLTLVNVRDASERLAFLWGTTGLAALIGLVLFVLGVSGLRRKLS